MSDIILLTIHEKLRDFIDAVFPTLIGYYHYTSQYCPYKTYLSMLLM